MRRLPLLALHQAKEWPIQIQRSWLRAAVPWLRQVVAAVVLHRTESRIQSLHSQLRPEAVPVSPLAAAAEEEEYPAWQSQSPRSGLRPVWP